MSALFRTDMLSSQHKENSLREMKKAAGLLATLLPFSSFSTVRYDLITTVVPMGAQL